MLEHGDLTTEAVRIYGNPEERKLATNAGIIEATGYIEWSRLREISEFAKTMGYRKLGIAFCVGLKDEALVVSQFLERAGFAVCSVNCKVGGIRKSEVGVPKEFQGVSKTGYSIGYIACNPVGQALVLAEAGTELNILLGLCVGHDTHFLRTSKAPVTVLAVKDRAFGHNPLAAIYTYYGRRRLENSVK